MFNMTCGCSPECFLWKAVNMRGLQKTWERVLKYNQHDSDCDTGRKVDGKI